jgi:hypothetical protein
MFQIYKSHTSPLERRASPEKSRFDCWKVSTYEHDIYFLKYGVSARCRVFFWVLEMKKEKNNEEWVQTCTFSSLKIEYYNTHYYT